MNIKVNPKAIKDLKRGEYFRLADSEAAPVWVRGEYIRQAKKYCTHYFDNINHEHLFAGNKMVYVGFEY